MTVMSPRISLLQSPVFLSFTYKRIKNGLGSIALEVKI